MAGGLQPFPLFIDAAPPESANYFSTIESTMGSLQMLASSSSRIRKPRVSLPTKMSNYVRLRYYQYEVTFGLYMLTPREKLILNTLLLTILSAILYALYWGSKISLSEQSAAFSTTLQDPLQLRRISVHDNTNGSGNSRDSSAQVSRSRQEHY